MFIAPAKPVERTRLRYFCYLLLVYMTVSAAAFCQLTSENSLPMVNTAPTLTAGSYVIAIDPGHPSETSRGCAHHGLTELQICWDVALKLEKLIAADPLLRPVKTKEAVDILVTNRQRAEIANAAGASVMLRLHCDSGKGSGCTLYYPDRQGTVQGVAGPSQKIIEQSRAAAEAIQKGLQTTLAGLLKVNPIKTDSVTFVGAKQGALTGSIFSQVPAVVIEMVYLNNASDAAFIAKPENQQIMAEAMYAGIKEYLAEIAEKQN